LNDIDTAIFFLIVDAVRNKVVFGHVPDARRLN
jgi:hypothetical protein